MKYLLSLTICFFSLTLSAQVAISTYGTAPHASAMLHIKGTEKGILIPRMLSSQLSNIEIGEELFISVNTVKSHLSRLYLKLNATSRTEVMARVREMA